METQSGRKNDWILPSVILFFLMVIIVVIFFIFPPEWMDAVRQRITREPFWMAVITGVSASFLSALTVYLIDTLANRNQPELAEVHQKIVDAADSLDNVGLQSDSHKDLIIQRFEMSADSTILRTMHEYQDAHLPTHSFTASNEPLVKLNRLLNQDLVNAKTYIFSGQSGSHLAQRLEVMGAIPKLDLTVILPNLRHPKSVGAAAQYWQKSAAATDNGRAGRDPLERSEVNYVRTQQLRIAHGIWALIRNRARVDNLVLVLDDRPHYDRVECFDSALWISLFSDAENQFKYPRTLRFAAGSVPYQTTSEVILRSRRFYSTVKGNFFEFNDASGDDDDCFETFQEICGPTFFTALAVAPAEIQDANLLRRLEEARLLPTAEATQV